MRREFGLFMPFQPSMPDAISSEESEALARFVHDLQSRMDQVSTLLSERGNSNTAILAGSICRDLHVLENLLTGTSHQITSDSVPAYM
jgi:hypothetical protein